MTIRKYVAWPWGHWAVFLAGLALFVACASLLHVATFPDGYDPPRWPGWFAPLAWCLGNLRLYQARRRYADRIVHVTTQGVTLVVWDRDAARASLDLVNSWDNLEEDIERTIRFWAGGSDSAFPGEGRGQQRASEARAIRDWKIRDGMNGTFLEFALQTKPLDDRQHGIQARGLTRPKRVVVQVSGDVKGEPFRSLVRHELGHACIFALGISDFPTPGTAADTYHHRVMKEAGFHDA